MPAQKVEASVATGDAPRFRVSLWQLSLILVLIGIGVSGYLTYVKATDEPMVCVENGPFRCDVVQNSAYAELFGVPIAYLGLAVYFLIGGLMLVQDRNEFFRENGMLLTFGVVLFAFIYSMYLVYVQGVILQSWCQWCLIHEANMTMLFVVTSLRLRNFLAA